MKKIYYVLVILLLCSIFAACGSKSATSVPAKVLAEMEEAWRKEHVSELPWEGENGYIGTYGGAVVFCYTVNTCQYMEITVAGEVFAGGAGAIVYKDGEFYGIPAAYEAGILTQENIKSIAKRYEEYVHANRN